MVKLKSTFAAAILVLAAIPVSAQATYVDAQGDEYQFAKHWFLNLQGGAQYTLGEASFSDLLSPNVQIGLGYQFNPVFGMRLQANGWQSKGGWSGYRAVAGAKPYTADYKWKYVAPGLDFMFNMSNLFCGWNPNCVVNLTAFVGAGVNVGWGNDELNDMAAVTSKIKEFDLEYLWDGTKVRPFGRAGIDLEFKVSKAVSIMVEGNANMISDKYNSKKADNLDWYFNALAGLRINLGKSHTKNVKPTETPAPVPVPVKQEYVAPVEKPKPQPKVEKKVEEIRRDVFFGINTNKIAESEQAKIKDVVDYLNKYPEAKVSVTGYADKGTGNTQINNRLAAKRAAAVVWLLKTQYGISAERISEDSKGASVQPFADNDKNRVTILIAR